jgi:hypothetical protein
MNNSIYDHYLPRNEHQLCELFEVLLFMRTEEFEEFIPGGFSEEEMEYEESFTLTDKEIEDLSKKGIINRIFRRWYQTNWGLENVSKHFSGETPRQELSRIYPKINQGKDYLSVNLEKQGKEWRVRPYYYSESFLEKQGGLFLYGLKRLKETGQEISEPFFDLDFAQFINWLNFGEVQIKEDNKFENEFFKYWNLFLEMAPINIISNLKLKKLNKKEFSELYFETKDCLIDFFSSQAYDKDSYLYFDQLFFELWQIMREFDRDLIDYEKLANLKIKEFKELDKDKKFKKSIESFYNLGILLDRYILFPIERYFNGAEMVWTDQKMFITDMFVTTQILKGKMNIERLKNRQRNISNILGIDPLDLRYMWFAPCTVFRLIGPIFQYFH